jgi:hypothetical protein
MDHPGRPRKSWRSFEFCSSHNHFQQKVTSVVSRVVALITDDLDNSQADETVSFALDGASYEIDLNDAHVKSCVPLLSRT